MMATEKYAVTAVVPAVGAVIEPGDGAADSTKIHNHDSGHGHPACQRELIVKNGMSLNTLKLIYYIVLYIY